MENILQFIIPELTIFGIYVITNTLHLKENYITTLSYKKDKKKEKKRKLL